MAEETNKRYYRTIYFNEDDYRTLQMFERIIKKDKTILASVPPEKKLIVNKNGILSYGLRYLVNLYVTKNKEAFLASMNKNKENAETENNNI